MDRVRYPVITGMRFWADSDVVIPIQWYFVEEGTPYVPVPGPFRSRLFAKEDTTDWAVGAIFPGLLGEQFGSKRIRTLGQKPPWALPPVGTHFCGSLRAWNGFGTMAQDPPLTPLTCGCVDVNPSGGGADCEHAVAFPAGAVIKSGDVGFFGWYVFSPEDFGTYRWRATNAGPETQGLSIAAFIGTCSDLEVIPDWTQFGIFAGNSPACRSISGVISVFVAIGPTEFTVPDGWTFTIESGSCP